MGCNKDWEVPFQVRTFPLSNALHCCHIIAYLTILFMIALRFVGLQMFGILPKAERSSSGNALLFVLWLLTNRR